MDMNSSSLVAAWSALPKEPVIAYYGQDSLLEGIKISISEYKAFTEDEKLDALNTMVGSKHCLVIAPATCGSYVPISQMPTKELIFQPFSSHYFDGLVTLLKDHEAQLKLWKTFKTRF